MKNSKRVKIGELKAKLSSYLRKVAEGESIVVLDRDNPVALLLGYSEGQGAALEVRPPLKPPRDIRSLKASIRRKGRMKSSSLEILQESRGQS